MFVAQTSVLPYMSIQDTFGTEWTDCSVITSSFQDNFCFDEINLMDTIGIPCNGEYLPELIIHIFSIIF